MKYASTEDLNKYLGATVDETLAEILLEGVSRAMDKMANRKLVADPVGSGEDYEEQYYDGNGKGFISIDDCQEITHVSEGDQYGDNLVEVETSDLITYPRKAPYRKILKKTGSFEVGVQNIKIEGRFGYLNELPGDLKLACTIIAAGAYTATGQSPASVSSEKYIDYSVTYADDKGWADFENAKAIVEKYQKIEF